MYCVSDSVDSSVTLAKSVSPRSACPIFERVREEPGGALIVALIAIDDLLEVGDGSGVVLERELGERAAVVDRVGARGDDLVITGPRLGELVVLAAGRRAS